MLSQYLSEVDIGSAMDTEDRILTCHDIVMINIYFINVQNLLTGEWGIKGLYVYKWIVR